MCGRRALQRRPCETSVGPTRHDSTHNHEACHVATADIDRIDPLRGCGRRRVQGSRSALMATTVMEAPPRPRTETPILSIRGVSKRFGAVQALHDVDFEVHAGEVVALVGDNGAGKSTLVKILAGIHQPDTGEFYFDGAPVELDSPREASELGIATVYQD